MYTAKKKNDRLLHNLLTAHLVAVKSEKWKTTKRNETNDKFEKRLKRYANNVKCLLAVRLCCLSLSPPFSHSLPLFLFWSVWPGLLMHFTLYDLFANTLFGQTGGTGGRKEAGVGVGVWHSRRLGQLTQKGLPLNFIKHL